MKTQMKAVWAILAMTTVWLTINSSKVNTCINDQKEVDAIVENMIAELEEKHAAEQLRKESIPFSEAFANARAEYGDNGVFKWQDEYYTTEYKDDNIFVEFTGRVSGWVLNGDDKDDWCATNDRDECGVCAGTGPLTWYADRDGDGLGNANNMKLSCEEPAAFNE